MKLNKSRLNIWIDTLLFILLMAMAGIGFLIKYVLLAGYQRNEVYGNDVDLSFLGFDRHQWGTVHLVISLVFIFFLALHLILHLTQIKCMVKKWIPGNMVRYSFYILTGLLCLFLFLFPVMIKPELTQREFHFQQGNQRERIFSQDTVCQSGEEMDVDSEIHKKNIGMKKSSGNGFNTQSVEESDIQVFGYMTISELAEEYNLRTSDICRELNIPSEEINERIGRLKRDYGFEMEVLRKYVEKETNRIKHHTK